MTQFEHLKQCFDALGIAYEVEEPTHWWPQHHAPEGQHQALVLQNDFGGGQGEFVFVRATGAFVRFSIYDG